MSTFKDIFKKSFLQGFSRYDSSPENIIIAFAVATVFALYIFFAYRLLTRKTFYSKSFNIALVALALITTSVILAIQSNIVISLGMVGALSIVRFRTAIKEPMDLVFLFWSIATGIICGAGFAEIAAVLAFVLTLALFFLDRLPVGRAPKILLVSATGYDAEGAVLELVKKHCRYYAVKSRTLSGGQMDLVLEVRTESEGQLAKEVAALQEVISSSLLSHDGEVTY
ncbi:MAG: DUF4956 domain-containing protein [Treponema sp.]|nr:DUF4956 domain-containing protein [Treponema sp.]MCR5621744.1 DUF4956 domain-containing protein [Treponema sp.]